MTSDRLPTALAVALALVLTGCATARPHGAVLGKATYSPGSQTAPLIPLLPCPSGNGGRAIIDYVDFVSYQGRSYLAKPSVPGFGLPSSALGDSVAVVRCQLSTIQPSADYVGKDGDAGFLPAGTELLAVHGYPTSFRLAALREGSYRIYEVDTAPRARTGGDLLPLNGLVRSIDIVDADTWTHVLGRVTDPQEIASLVGAIVQAPVNQASKVGLAEFTLRFHLLDGTTVLRAWYPRESIVERGILVPPSFDRALQRRMAIR